MNGIVGSGITMRNAQLMRINYFQLLHTTSSGLVKYSDECCLREGSAMCECGLIKRNVFDRR